jgi:hypothetical protein
LRPTSMEHDPQPKVGPTPWDPPKFWGQHLGDHWVFLEYLLLCHQYIYTYIWVQVLRNFPWVGEVGSMSGLQLGWLESIEDLGSLMENGSRIEREMVHLLFKIVFKIMHHSCTLVCLFVDWFFNIYIFSFLAF